MLPESCFAAVSQRWTEMGLQEKSRFPWCFPHPPPSPSLVLPVHVMTLFKVEQLQCKRVKGAHPRMTLEGSRVLPCCSLRPCVQVSDGKWTQQGLGCKSAFTTNILRPGSSVCHPKSAYPMSLKKATGCIHTRAWAKLNCSSQDVGEF